MNLDDLDRLVEKLDLEGKVRLLTGASVWRTPAEPDIGLAPMLTSDGPAGVRGEGWDERGASLSLPSATALAASWDEDLAGKMGGLLAAEARRKGVHVVLAPTLNLHRSPLGGRHFECYSEDPLLTGRIGAAVIRGVQAGGVAATAKHFVANDSETQRLTLDARLDERTLREVYLAPFEAAVEAGVWAVMSAYNGVNGASMSESPLLDEPLKGEWGFDGVVVSDWGAVRSTVASALAAQDLAMPGPQSPWGEALVAAVRAGQVPEAAIDEKVRRLLLLASRVGALGPTAAPPPVKLDARALIRQAVAAGTVLLRNESSGLTGDPILPLDPARLRRVAVLGPNAARPRIQGGGSAGVYATAPVSPLDGIRHALHGHAEVVHTPGMHADGPPAPLDTGNARNPRTGEPGVLVRRLDAAGEELYAEHRLTGRLPEPGGPAAAAVEISALVRPHVGGRWEVAAAGWGRIVVEVDGRVVIDEAVPRHTDDPATVHLAPPYRVAGVDLAEGREVELVMRRESLPGDGVAAVLAAEPPRRDEAAELAAAVALARSSDVAVVVVGTTERAESEGVDRAGLELPRGQDALVRAVVAANRNTVVVVNSGGPVALPWREETPAVLLSWFPGEEAGNGLADVLFGREEPGGRLPTTWADRALAPTLPVDGVLAYTEGLHVGYRAWLQEEEQPAFWFGHGLGYTTWSYEELRVPGEAAPGRPVRVMVRVRNTGDRAGREVVQVYLSGPRDRDRPARWLAGFAPVRAQAGQSAEVVIDLPARAFQHWDDGWRTGEGAFTVHAGRSAADLPLSAVIA